MFRMMLPHVTSTHLGLRIEFRFASSRCRFVIMPRLLWNNSIRHLRRVFYCSFPCQGLSLFCFYLFQSVVIGAIAVGVRFLCLR